MVVLPEPNSKKHFALIILFFKKEPASKLPNYSILICGILFLKIDTKMMAVIF